MTPLRMKMVEEVRLADCRQSSKLRRGTLSDLRSISASYSGALYALEASLTVQTRGTPHAPRQLTLVAISCGCAGRPSVPIRMTHSKPS
jgi:hypothetical protein